MALKYTKTKPKEFGYYWALDIYGDADIYCYNGSGDVYVADETHSLEYFIEVYQITHWAGPIPKPGRKGFTE